jgi:hypothetical protein
MMQDLLKILVSAQLVNTKNSTPCSQKHATEAYPEAKTAVTIVTPLYDGEIGVQFTAQSKDYSPLWFWGPPNVQSE